jgi:hypothetical protein
VEHGIVDGDEYARFIADLEALEQQGRYFYSLTGYAYVGQRLEQRTERAGEPS